MAPPRAASLALAAFGGPLAAAGCAQAALLLQAAAALDVDVQLVQVDLGPQKAEELAGGWLAAAQEAEGGMCAAVPVGTGYCDAQSMTYARGGSCTGSYCAGLATIEQCCDVVAAMPECAGAEHVGFIPASGPEGSSACGCCSSGFRNSARYVAEFYGATQPGAISAKGDPHLQNIFGQRFDLLQPGQHTLLRIPKSAPAAAGLLLGVSAWAQQVGTACSDMYFRELNVTGAWADGEQAGGFRFRADEADEAGCDGASWKMSFGKLELKVAHGCTSLGVRYLNFYVRHLGRAGFDVGGLLGGDDHSAAAEPPEACARRVSLARGHHASDAEASLA